MRINLSYEAHEHLWLWLSVGDYTTGAVPPKWAHCTICGISKAQEDEAKP